MTKTKRIKCPADDPTSRALQDALHAVRQHLDMPISYISFFIDEDIVFEEVSCDDAEPLLKTGDRRAAEGTYCQAVLKGYLPQLLPDTGQSEVAQGMTITHQAPIGAVVSVPLKDTNQEIFGMFCCLSPDPRPELTERDHHTMTMFANMAQETIRNSQRLDHRLDTLRQKILQIMEDDDFDIALQPIVDLNSQSISGAEALTRFRAVPYRSPDKWFADAETVGLRLALEEATFSKALSHLGSFEPGQYLSLNVSPEILEKGRLTKLLDGVDVTRVLIEVTEHTKISDMDALQSEMRRLKDIGVKFAIDDLGAGHSGLSTVLQLKPDVLKMDRSLVSDIHANEDCRALAMSLVYFAGQIQARLIAEGIEKQDEADLLKSIGVTYGQGYLLGHPKPTADYFAMAA